MCGKGSAFTSLQAKPNPAMQPELLNPPNGSWGFVNVQPTPTPIFAILNPADGSRGSLMCGLQMQNNTHRIKFPIVIRAGLDQVDSILNVDGSGMSLTL